MVLSIISLIGLILAIFPALQIINFIGAGLIGLGFSGIPPLLISSSGRIFSSGRDLSLTILFIVGTTSGSIIPFIISLLADYSFLFSMVIAIIFMVIFFIFVIIRKNYRKTGSPSNKGAKRSIIVLTNKLFKGERDALRHKYTKTV